ncbi:unnamed protein product [Paramecium sonneborni]|uniref:Uncharacterized protein n=1 Tax=Paramecium sonneborni TaxID=65129 RepID=A0A8S1JTH8_9CILI|nr:unnamed protein product [Paramecium sonneborni]
MFEDEDDNENNVNLEEQNYRDRAEERRKGIRGEVKKGEYVELEGFEKDIKINGLDYSLIEQPQSNTLNKIEDKSNLIAKIKKDLTSAKEKIPKKATHPMAIKIEAFLSNKNQITPLKNTMTFIYKYDTDPNYGISLPQFFTKKYNQDGDDPIQVIFDEKSIQMIKESIINTNNLTIKRYQERHKFDQKVLIQSTMEDEESDDIFNDAKQVNKPNIDDVNKMLQVEIENKNFDITEYLSKNQFDQKTYNQLKQTQEQEEKEREEKLKKHKKMLEGQDDDYYYECYQPIGLSIAEEKDHQAEVEAKKQVDPNFKNYDFIKKDLRKKKKYRENYQKQLDQIEDIIQKKNK